MEIKIASTSVSLHGVDSGERMFKILDHSKPRKNKKSILKLL